ncbi:hypothetical protein HDC94_000735 [Leifsonia sp. AK011]|uniref:hypothetical protein n=1 Tax=Leifsonia sp. AK011 TaxID=2723075 RepID=UPI0015CA9C54|nr:hypothetical protein [Leifsonia sp. AK011]NYF09579.1 hypothetical protein [Leifsonia sp. AK011]
MASDFDPRFDPAFQRGFDGAVERSATPAPRVESVPSASVEPTPVPAEVQRQVVEPVETSLPTQLPTLRGNPFIPVLWITAALFAIAGAAGQYFATFLNYSAPASSAALEYVLPSVLFALSPWLFAAGLALGIATLVIHALRWRPAN